MPESNKPGVAAFTAVASVALVAAVVMLAGVVESAYFFEGNLYMDVSDAPRWRIVTGLVCIVIVAMCTIGMIVMSLLSKHHKSSS